MRQFLINLNAKFRMLLKIKCKHRFIESEVRNLKIDPRCKFCDKKLSQLTNKQI